MADQMATVVKQWREVLPDLDTSPLLVLGRVQRIVSLTDPTLRSRFADAGLAPGDFDLLAALRRSGGVLGQGDLGAAMLVTAGAVSKRVDRLHASGLVAREPAPHDARARVVALTVTGRELTDRLMAAHLEAEAELVSGLSARDRRALGALLARLLVDLEDAPARRSGA